MGMILLPVIFMATLSATTTAARVLPKRSISTDLSAETLDYPDYSSKTDIYPVSKNLIFSLCFTYYLFF